MPNRPEAAWESPSDYLNKINSHAFKFQIFTGDGNNA
jgi:hypothetical protein